MLSIATKSTATPPEPDDPWGLDPQPTALTPAPEAPADDAAAARPAASARQATWSAVVKIAAGLAVAVAIGSGLWLARASSQTSPVVPAAAPGRLVLSSHPPGATVSIAGRSVGATPVVVDLPAGRHSITLAAADGSGSEVVDVEVTAGGTATRHVALTVQPATPTGGMRIESQTPGALVTVDGVAAGRTPLTIPSVAAGSHLVVVGEAGRAMTREVTVTAGATTSLVLGDSTPAAPLSGWISLRVPFDVQVFEQGRLVGVSQSERIMIGAGRHDLTLVNEALGFSRPLTVNVAPGQTLNAAVEVPAATVSINALPWAEVDVDGRSYGATPLGALSLPIGARTITFRHPSLGARTERFTVRLGVPNRLSIDLRK